eukprot:82065-Pelagomonas_calceolata.AAC.4
MHEHMHKCSDPPQPMWLSSSPGPPLTHALAHAHSHTHMHKHHPPAHAPVLAHEQQVQRACAVPHSRLVAPQRQVASTAVGPDQRNGIIQLNGA